MIADVMPGADQVWAALGDARIAGGAVRDHLLGLDVADIDFATPLAPPEVMRRLAAAGIKAVPTGVAHGTVTAVVNRTGFEITTLRRDVTTDGRHAVVAFTDDWQADAARRDFTINAMSMARDGTLYDYFGGTGDLGAGIVRFVGCAEARITEDYLRILRFFRFFARYGRAPPDEPAIVAITRLGDGIRRLSAERVWSELKRILAAPDPIQAVALMQECQVLQRIFPGGAQLQALQELTASGAPADALLRSAALLRQSNETPEMFAARLKLSSQEQDTLRAYLSPGTLSPKADPAELRRVLAEERLEVLLARAWLAQPGQPGERLRARLAGIEPPVFPLQGRDLLALGVAAGPRIGEILAGVRGWWLERGCIDDRAACLQKARSLAQGTDRRS